MPPWGPRKLVREEDNMNAIDQDKLGDFLKQTGGMVAAGFNCASRCWAIDWVYSKRLYDIGPCDSADLAKAIEFA